MRYLLLGVVIALGLVPGAGAHPLEGCGAGPAIGHMQGSATVRQGGQQLNDAGANTILVGVYGSCARVASNGAFLALDAFGFATPEPHDSTIAVLEGFRYRLSYDGMAGLHARLGWTVRDDAALYVLLGAAASHVTYDLPDGTTSRWQWAPQIGVGAELHLASRWSLRGDFVFDRTQFDVGATEVQAQVRWRSSAALIWRF